MAEHLDALHRHRSGSTAMSAAVESPWIPEAAMEYAGSGTVVGPGSNNVLHPSSGLGAPKVESRQ